MFNVQRKLLLKVAMPNYVYSVMKCLYAVSDVLGS